MMDNVALYSGFGLLIVLIIIIAILFFWIWMFFDMWKSRKIKKETKIILTILFLIANLLTAIMWAIFRKRL
jgi:protein-S-isoprenylcysteine O-methyltransferase Ste14